MMYNIGLCHIIRQSFILTIFFSIFHIGVIWAEVPIPISDVQRDVWVRKNASGQPYQVYEWLKNGKPITFDKGDILFGSYVNKNSKQFQGTFFFSGKRIKSNKFRAVGKDQNRRVIWDKFQLTLSDNQQIILSKLSPWHPNLTPPDSGTLKAALNEKYGGEVIASSSKGYLVLTNLYDVFPNVTPSSTSWNCSYNGGVFGLPYGLAYKLENGETVWERFILIEKNHIVDFNDSTEARHAQGEATFHYTSLGLAYVLPDENTFLVFSRANHSSILRLNLAPGGSSKPYPSSRVVDATQVRMIIKELFGKGVIKTQPLSESERFGTYTSEISSDDKNWCAKLVDREIYNKFFLEHK